MNDKEELKNTMVKVQDGLKGFLYNMLNHGEMIVTTDASANPVEKVSSRFALRSDGKKNLIKK